MRKAYYIRWFSSPIVKRVITAAVVEGVKDHNENLPDFFLEAAVKFLAGPPYEPLTETRMHVGWVNEGSDAATP